MIDKFFGKNRFLSNFYPCEVEYSGIKFPTVEHAYQAAKCKYPADYDEFLGCERPGEAKRLGRKMPMRSDWDDVKIGIMRGLLEQKFAKEPFRAWLLNTGNQQLIEGNTWGDVFWGVCNGKGENHLGKLIMEVRNGIKKEDL